MYSFESISNIINRELLKIYINMNAYFDLKTRVYNKYLSLMYIKKYNISYNLILSGQISPYSPYLFQTLIENWHNKPERFKLKIKFYIEAWRNTERYKKKKFSKVLYRFYIKDLYRTR